MKRRRLFQTRICYFLRLRDDSPRPLKIVLPLLGSTRAHGTFVN